MSVIIEVRKMLFSYKYIKNNKKRAIRKPLIGFMYGSYRFLDAKSGHPVSASQKVFLIFIMHLHRVLAKRL